MCERYHLAEARTGRRWWREKEQVRWSPPSSDVPYHLFSPMRHCMPVFTLHLTQFRARSRYSKNTYETEVTWSWQWLTSHLTQEYTFQNLNVSQCVKYRVKGRGQASKGRGCKRNGKQTGAGGWPTYLFFLFFLWISSTTTTQQLCGHPSCQVKWLFIQWTSDYEDYTREMGLLRVDWKGVNGALELS